jgi:hypothetical protein
MDINKEPSSSSSSSSSIARNCDMATTNNVALHES